MSGWTKYEKSLERDPRTLRMVRELKRSCNAGALPDSFYVTLTCGALARFWAYADDHIRRDDTLGLGTAEIDELLGVMGFCGAMPEDWLSIQDDKTVILPNFQEHNGVEARKKALTQKRVETHRQRSGVNNRVTGALTTALPDQTRLDKTKTRPEEEARATPALDLVAWDQWIEYRRKRRPAIKPESMVEAAKALAQHGNDQAAVVTQSIAAGWQGLFPLKTEIGSGRAPRPVPKTIKQLEDEARARGEDPDA